MSTDITSASSARMGLAQALQARAPAAPARAAAPVQEPTAATPKVQEIVKPEVRFDPDEMRRELQEAVARLNDQLRSKGRNLSFAFDEVADRTVITVKNSQTGEVVRQLPSEAVLRIAHNLESMKGVLFNEKL